MSNISKDPVIKALAFWQNKFPQIQQEAIIKIQGSLGTEKEFNKFKEFIPEALSDFGGKETEELLVYIDLYREYVTAVTINDVEVAKTYNKEELKKIKTYMQVQQSIEEIAINIFYGWLNTIDNEEKTCLQQIVHDAVTDGFSKKIIEQCKQEIKELLYPQQEELVTFLETFMVFVKEHQIEEAPAKKTNSKETIERIKKDLLTLTPKERWEFIRDLQEAVLIKIGYEPVLNDKGECIDFELKEDEVEDYEGANDNE